MVASEALAGTRIRGQTPSADNELLQELLSSKKDMLENQITGQFIQKALLELEENGWLEKSKDNLLKSYDDVGDTNQKEGGSGTRQRYFVRRLRNLQVSRFGNCVQFQPSTLNYNMFLSAYMPNV